MRNVPPFRCPRCGSEQLEGERCVRCDVRLVDANGVGIMQRQYDARRIASGEQKVGAALLAPGALFVALYSWLAEPRPSIGILLGCALAFLLAPLLMREHFAEWLALRKRTRTLKKKLRIAPEAAIGDAKDGMVRVRGKVRVLRPAKVGPGGRVAAGLERKQTDEITTRNNARGSTTRTTRHLTEYASCGRFVVEDDTGIAVVDEDAFDLWSVSGGKVDGSWIYTANEGDEVTIVGPAKWMELPTDIADIDALEAKAKTAGGGYRDGKKAVLIFDGAPDERVSIVVGPPERTADGVHHNE